MNDFNDVAVKLAGQAGKIMLEHFSHIVDREYKEDHTPLTEADTQINQLVVDTLKSAFPDHKVLGEELQDMSGDSNYTWVCDPIDGTTPFSNGIPIATFSLALCKDGEAILGVVKDPFSDRLYVAEKGKGATINGEKLQVNDVDSLENQVVSLPSKDFVLLNVEMVKEIRKRNGSFLNFSSTVYGSMQVALGNFVAVVHSYTKPWDAAASKVIIEEAGGMMTDLDGNDQRYDQDINGYLATNGKVHEEVLKLLKM